MLSTHSHLNSNKTVRKCILEINNNRKIVEIRVKPQTWKMRGAKVVLPFSVASAIYERETGDFKIKAFLQTVKANAMQEILIVLCEGAHLNALSLSHGTISEALAISRQQANRLSERFSEDFSGCRVRFWSDYVWQHQNYAQVKALVSDLYNTDEGFRHSIRLDAMKLKVPEDLSSEMTEEFYFNSQLDLLEMLVGIKLMHDDNYKTLIYPGPMPTSYKELLSPGFFDMLFINASIKCKDLPLTKLNTA